MRKPKSRVKQIAAHKRAYKRTLRLKASRKKLAIKKKKELEKRKAEKNKFLEFMKKLQEARNKGEM